MRELVLSVWAGPGGVSDETALLDGEARGVDELGLRVLATLLEERFVIDVEEGELDAERFGTVARIVAYVEGKLAVTDTCRLGAGALRQRDAPPVSGALEIGEWTGGGGEGGGGSDGTESAA